MSPIVAAKKAIIKKLSATFPRTIFTAGHHTYAGGGSITVNWTDGPARDQLSLVKAGCHYPVIFERAYSDTLQQRMIDRIWREIGAGLEGEGFSKPSPCDLANVEDNYMRDSELFDRYDGVSTMTHAVRRLCAKHTSTTTFFKP